MKFGDKKIVVGVLLGVVVLTMLVWHTPRDSSVSQFELEVAQFKDFAATYGKSYKSQEEFETRFRTFLDNLAFIRIQNQLKQDWVLGMNQFGDMSMPEFKSIYLRYQHVPQKAESYSFDPNLQYPATVNWQNAGAVTPVKNQGQCGSCWSFSTTGAIEGAWKIAGHPLVSLSEQQLIDCSRPQGNNGCEGGLMNNGFMYVISNRGINTESNYPYTGQDGTCNAALAKTAAATLTTYGIVLPSSSNALLTAIAQQPISVAVEADQPVWQFYTGGVVTSNCGTSLDHGVLATGYDTTAKPPFYWVKNSWGSAWGMAGYIQIGIVDGDGVCGIQIEPSYPIV